jgi:hypothetical protein
VDLRRVVVVDNNSHDGSIDFIGNPELPLSILRNQTNVGFAKASNQAARGSAADFLLFLNPDVRVSPGCIRGAVEILSSDRRAAIVGVQMRDACGRILPSCSRFPTARMMLSECSALARFPSRLFQGSLMSDWNHRESRMVDHVIGAFYMIRRSVFEALGGFDERYFLYIEDLDLSRRAALGGWRCYYAAGTAAQHPGGGCSRRIPVKRQLYLARSRVRYARKHLGWSCAILSGILSALTFPVIGASVGLRRLLPAAGGKIPQGVRPS